MRGLGCEGSSRIVFLGDQQADCSEMSALAILIYMYLHYTNCDVDVDEDPFRGGAYAPEKTMSLLYMF